MMLEKSNSCIRRRAGVLVFYKNKVLVVLGKISNKWSFPKGESNEDELLEDTAVRELKEETGFEFTNKIEFFFKTKYTTYYKIDVSNEDFIQSPSIMDKKEIKKCKFMSLENLKNIRGNHDIKHFVNYIL